MKQTNKCFFLIMTHPPLCSPLLTLFRVLPGGVTEGRGRPSLINLDTFTVLYNGMLILKH
jgi:hypothetical protein